MHFFNKNRKIFIKKIDLVVFVLLDFYKPEEKLIILFELTLKRPKMIQIS